MNMNISLNNGLECNILIKADDKYTYETNKIRTKNKIMNNLEGNSKSSKKNRNKNFLRKQTIKENNNCTNSPKDKESISEDFFNNNIFKYYYSTIEYMKKYFNCYINKDYNNSISKNNNVLNINNYFICGKNISNVSYVKTSNILKNNIMKNNFCINNYQDKKINFINNNCKNENDKNKISGSFNNQEKEDSKKINAFSKEIINNINLNSNNNKFQNLIIKLNCPSFNLSNYKNNENNNVKSESNTISNKVENKNNGNNLEEEEYTTQMFGKKGWICVLCNNFNFETRIKCNRCKALKNPKKINKTNRKNKNEINLNNDDENVDWICSKCQNLNYSFRTICNRCKVPKICQFKVKPFLYQNIIYNNIMRCQPKLMASYAILNNMPNMYLNKIV